MKKDLDFGKTIKHVGITTIIWNAILSIIKLIVGILACSSAMISDAVHSASDIFTTIIVMIGAKISTKDSDDKHLYGHERFESIASIFLGVLLGATALGIGYGAVNVIINFSPSTAAPDKYIYLALGGAILSIIVKAVMYFYTIDAAKRIKSNSLKADAWHHLSDSLSSIGSALGIVGMLIGNGWEILDPIAGIIICLIILKVAFDIIKSAVDQLVDKSIKAETANEIKDKIMNVDKVMGIKSFKSRQFGNKMYVDVEIYLDSELSFKEANDVAENVHEFLEKEYEDLKHCAVCVKPVENAVTIDKKE